MKLDEIKEYCRRLPGIYETHPFGPDPLCYKVGGKVVVQINEKSEAKRITCKTTPEKAEEYRSMFPGLVVRGYHCPPVQQPHWNSMDYTKMPEPVLMQMIEEAYEIVTSKLTRKEKANLEQVCKVSFCRTDGRDNRFAKLCEELDETLAEAVAGKFDRSKYTPYNKRDKINDVVLVLDGEEAVGCASFRFYDEKTVELKRVFLREEYRGKGLAVEMLRRLEALAKTAGYSYMILETGHILAASCRCYEKCGYKVIPNYGVYADMPLSVCMKKKL
jgi:predicted DNA-binding protein (MmcQ/YjbR family)/GNAT superfamily N-acetyltransferase